MPSLLTLFFCRNRLFGTHKSTEYFILYISAYYFFFHKNVNPTWGVTKQEKLNLKTPNYKWDYEWDKEQICHKDLTMVGVGKTLKHPTHC